MEPEVHYRIHNSLQRVFSLRQINPVTAAHPVSVKIQFNIIIYLHIDRSLSFPTKLCKRSLNQPKNKPRTIAYRPRRI